ncbi:MAG TPA: diaminopimelate epimerase [Steroidobacteraceae bacterium]|nr:diaminopimelate epimerase [Steroidobacteraceae bacterium]
MRIDFTKMHGAGNDFVVFDAPADQSLLQPQLLRALADRRTGIGFDQALILEKPRRADRGVYYRIFNADGDEVEQCGNGARCIAALLQHRGAAHNGSLTLDSPAGLVQARIDGKEVSVDMGVPNFDPRSLPFDTDTESDSYSLELAGRTLAIGAVSIGNPHAVLTVASVAAAPVETLGPQIERHPRFSKRVNAGFLEIVDRAQVRLRVWERGAGETRSCGTGACAAVAIGRRRGLLGEQVRVSVRGGELRVNWAGPGEHIWLTGPAEISFEGHVEV